MTKYEQKNKIKERFIIVYSWQKILYLKELGFIYLFKCFNEKSHAPFWVYDVSPEIRKALDNYKRPNEENNQ